jgi:hypothetical protein
VCARRALVCAAVEKLWYYHTRNQGQVKQHISPYAQSTQNNFIHDLPQKMMRRVTSNMGDWLLPTVLLFAIPAWAESCNKDIEISERD